MASQPSQRMRRIPSPSTKQGPMKATKSFGLASGSRPGGVKKSSPSASPTQQCGGEFHRKRRSPDHRQSPDRALSPVFKGRSGSSPVIKRTSSLDNIVGPYLKGEWPREPAVSATTAASCYSTQPAIVITPFHPLTSTLDQHTQTPSEWDEVLDRRRVSGLSPSHKRSLSVGNGAETGKENKVKGLRLGKSNLLRHGKHSPRLRGSTEGINQEIEKLSLRINSGPDADCLSSRPQDIMTPDGHRAPVQELLDHHNHHHHHRHYHHQQQQNTRSAITQTPSRTLAAAGSSPSSPPVVSTNNVSSSSASSATSDPVLRASVSCTPGCDVSATAGAEDCEEEEEEEEGDVSAPCGCCTSSSPLLLEGGGCSSSGSSSAASSRASSSAAKDEKDCDSPDPKEFKFIREPPDGAEKVNLKVIEEDRRNTSYTLPVMFKNPSLRIPSTKSAFNLLKLYQPSQFKPPPPTSPGTPSPPPQPTTAATY